jgi:hypothetical protein
VDLVAELPVVVADPVGGGCSVARRRPVLRLRAIPPAARMSTALVGAPAAVVVSPDRIDRTFLRPSREDVVWMCRTRPESEDLE